MVSSLPSHRVPGQGQLLPLELEMPLRSQGAEVGSPDPGGMGSQKGRGLISGVCTCPHLGQCIHVCVCDHAHLVTPACRCVQVCAACTCIAAAGAAGVRAACPAPARCLRLSSGA